MIFAMIGINEEVNRIVNPPRESLTCFDPVTAPTSGGLKKGEIMIDSRGGKIKLD